MISVQVMFRAVWPDSTCAGHRPVAWKARQRLALPREFLALQHRRERSRGGFGPAKKPLHLHHKPVPDPHETRAGPLESRRARAPDGGAERAGGDRPRHRRADVYNAVAGAPRVSRRPVRLDRGAVAGPTAEVAGTVPRRSYSIASQSGAGDVLRFIIRVIPEGKASDYLMEMPLGTTVSMTGPHGFFVLDAVHTGDIVFAATGTGIAAVMPMLGELALRPPATGRGCCLLGSPAAIGHLRARRDRAPGGRDRRRAGDPSDRARPGLDGGPGPHHARAARSAAAPAARPRSTSSATAR